MPCCWNTLHVYLKNPAQRGKALVQILPSLTFFHWPERELHQAWQMHLPLRNSSGQTVLLHCLVKTFSSAAASGQDSPGMEKRPTSLPLTVVWIGLHSFSNLSLLSHMETARFLLEGEGKKNALKREQIVWWLLFSLSSEHCSKDVLLKSDETE